MCGLYGFTGVTSLSQQFVWEDLSICQFNITEESMHTYRCVYQAILHDYYKTQ